MTNGKMWPEDNGEKGRKSTAEVRSRVGEVVGVSMLPFSVVIDSITCNKHKPVTPAPVRELFMNESRLAASTRWRAVALGLLFALVGLVVWDGADRRAVDATQPLAQSPPPVVRQPAPQTLKIGSFNIHSGKGSDGVRNLARTADLLANTDFAGLYEVRATSEAGQPNQAAAVAQRNDAAWLFAPSERQWWSDHFGNGLMNRIPVRSVIRLPLVNTRGKAFRNALLSTIELQGTDVRILSVHIDREADRQRQLRTMIELFLDLKEPCALMGDLNTPETDPLLIELLEHRGVKSPLHESLPDGPPRGTIDWIFTRGLKTISAKLVENQASDHPFLEAELAPLDAS